MWIVHYLGISLILSKCGVIQSSDSPDPGNSENNDNLSGNPNTWIRCESWQRCGNERTTAIVIYYEDVLHDAAISTVNYNRIRIPAHYSMIVFPDVNNRGVTAFDTAINWEHEELSTLMNQCKLVTLIYIKIIYNIIFFIHRKLYFL